METKKLSVTRALQEGFSVVVDHFGAFAKTILAYGSATLLALIIFIITTISWIRHSAEQFLPTLNLLSACSGAQCIEPLKALLRQMIPFLFSNWPFLVVSVLVFSIFFAWLLIGYLRFSLAMYDTKNGSWQQLFALENLGRALKCIISSLIVSVLVGLGSIFFVLPGLYLFLRLRFWVYFIADKNAGIFESIKLSWQATRYHGWDIFVLSVIDATISALAQVILGFLLGFGSLLIAPFTTMMFISAYRQLVSAKKQDFSQPYHTI